MMKVSQDKLDDSERIALRKQGGAWLKRRRELAGLSQREFAGRVDVGFYTFISQIEQGRGRIPPERYLVWADALKMDPRDFVRDLLAFYEPITHDILFGSAAAPSERPRPSHAPPHAPERHAAAGET